MSYIFLTWAGLITTLYIKLFTKLEIVGRENIPKNLKGIIFTSNHQSMIDSFIIGTFYWPFLKQIITPRLILWNTPEEKNFFKPGLMKFVFQRLRCIPVNRKNLTKTGFINFTEQVKSVLKNKQQNLLVFFEGTRSRDGNIGPFKPGLSKLIADIKPQVVPIRIIGFNQLQPVSEKAELFSRLHLNPFKKIRIKMIIGPDINLNSIINSNKPKKEIRQQIGHQIRQAVLRLS